jgi:hypothetical protein
MKPHLNGKKLGVGSGTYHFSGGRKLKIALWFQMACAKRETLPQK